MASIVFHLASTKDFHPRVDSPQFKVDSKTLEYSFKCGQKGKVFELGFFEKLMAFFKGPETDVAKIKMVVARKLVHEFGLTVRAFIEADKPDKKLDCKRHAIRIASELRKRVSNGTLEEFDKLINPKLDLVLFNDEDESGGVIEAFEADAAPVPAIPTYSISNLGASLSLEDAHDLYGAFYAEPKLYFSSDAMTNPADPMLSVLSESVSSGQSCDSCTSVQFMDLYGARLLEERRKDEILNLSKPALPIPIIAVSPSKPESVALPDSTAVKDGPVSTERRHSNFHGVEAQAKQLVHYTAEKLGGFVDDLGTKLNKFGEQVNGVFGVHVKSKDHAPVGIAIEVVAVDDAPGALMLQSIAGPTSVSVNQSNELPMLSDQVREPEDNETEVNPFVLAQQDEEEANKRYEESAREVALQLVKQIEAELEAEKVKAARPVPLKVKVPDSSVQTNFLPSPAKAAPSGTLPAPELVVQPEVIASPVPSPEKNNILAVIQNGITHFTEIIVDELEKGNQIENIPQKPAADSPKASPPSTALLKTGTAGSGGKQSVIQEFGLHVKDKAKGAVHEFTEVTEMLGGTAVDLWAASKGAWHKAGESFTETIRHLKPPAKDK